MRNALGEVHLNTSNENNIPCAKLDQAKNLVSCIVILKRPRQSCQTSEDRLSLRRPRIHSQKK
jgi:hypothetical protein